MSKNSKAESYVEEIRIPLSTPGQYGFFQEVTLADAQIKDIRGIKLRRVMQNRYETYKDDDGTYKRVILNRNIRKREKRAKVTYTSEYAPKNQAMLVRIEGERSVVEAIKRACGQNWVLK